MTESEIIKVLENELECVKRQCGNFCDNKRDCKHCDLVLKDEVIINAYEKSLDLINSENAEIDKLENELMKCKLEKEMMYQTVEEIKSEAIKEFADRLKNIADKTTIKYVDDDDKVSFLINEVDLDNLVKEMTEVLE